MDNLQKQVLIRMQMGKPIRGGNPGRRIDYKINDFYNDLNQIIYKWNSEDFGQLINNFKSINSKSFAWLRSQWFPSNYSLMHRGFSVSPNDGGHRLLLWYANIIEVYSDEINKYIKYKEEFEKNFILGNYALAESCLKNLEQDMGVSLWSIESSFSLYEYFGGLEKNKELLEKISSSEADAWIKTFAYFFSFKAEKGINNRQYVHRINNYLSKYDKDIRALFTEKLFPFSNFMLEDIEDILCYVFCFPIVDIYNTFINICVRVASDKSSPKYMYEGVQRALSLIDSVDDIVLKKLQFIVGVKSNLESCERDLKFLEYSDLYTKGEYAEVISKLNEEILIQPNCFELYEMYIKSHVMSDLKFNNNGDETLKNDLLIALYSSYVKDNHTPKSYFLLSRLLRLFTNSYMGASIACFFVDKYALGTDYVLLKGKEILSPVNNIKLISVVSSEKDIAIDYFKKLKEKSETLKLFSYVYLGEKIDSNEIDPNRLRWYAIKKELNEESESVWNKLKKWYDELVNDDSIYVSYQKERLSTELYYLYIRDDRFLDAEELLVDETIRNSYGTLRMDLDELFEKIGPKTKEIKKSICTPIAASLYYKGDYTQVYSNMANFLVANRLNKPSDLFGLEDSFGKERLYYFLKKVCVREVIDSMFDVFDTETDIDNERIDICRYLQANDIGRANEYIDEISQILQRRRILEGVKYFEDVKIELDFDNIYNAQHEIFEDGYKRFSQINLLSKEYTAYDASSNKLYVYSEESEKYSHAYVAFKELLEDYRQELAYGTFGLDPIIGTRIRHGHLQNNIRIAFESNNIAFICKSSTDRTYVASQNFEELSKSLDQNTKQQLIRYISDFSRKIDDYIEIIKKDYLRIRIDDKNEMGLFNFNIPPANVIILMDTARKYQNINLVRELFEEYWKQKIEDNLKRVELFFENDVKDYFIQLLTELGTNIKKLPESEPIRALLMDSISRARTDIQNAIKLICGWFKMPKEQSYDNYTADELVDICEEINKRVVPNYENFSLKKSINVSSKLKGKTFSHMVDILIILFTNAFNHSGYIHALNVLDLSLKIEECVDKLEIYMENNLSPSIELEELYDVINSMQEKLSECIKQREYYNYEGKSGYLKICKILEYNLSTQGYLEFGIDDNEMTYFVKVSMPKKYLIDGGNSSANNIN